MRELKSLPVPHVLFHYIGIVETVFEWDDKRIKSKGPVDRTRVPECPVPPRVKVQALDNGNRPNGPAWVWDWEADDGNGVWVVFDPERHEIPKSRALPDVGAKSLDLSAKSEVELIDDVAPASVDPPEEADEDEKPSELVVDEEDEDDVTAE